ncbi:MAG: aminotransferase class I/II-fold pyridoxal phosphate-dependent enzyme [Candidatus Omnitrophica bacterium]|nr:aminotransferase class I/II-fold pyridoxal phosphate-dependent enzyme [Candidatus Omnitrophota bacterium]
MDIKISKIVEDMAPSGIRVFFDLVLGMKDVISLGVGEPDFVTPWPIREKVIYSLEQGYTSYTSNKGMIELRRQIAHFLQQRYALAYDPEEEMLITVGVSEALDLAFRALLNRGDQVLIPEPSYVSYSPVVEMAGGVSIRLPTTADQKYKLTAAQVDRACMDAPGKVKAFLLNYPANPTGMSYTKAELNALARIVLKHNLVMVTDEVYDELTYDFDHTPFATLKGMKDRTVYLNGFSKAYAMTGLRIGWVAGPAKVVGAMTKIHQYTMLCASIDGQMGAIEALKNGRRSVDEMKREYKRRRNFMVGALNDLGLTCHVPEGAFYVFPSIRSTGQTSMDFAQNLLKQQKVALVPGTAFGPSGEGHVRISYAAAYEDLKEAVNRIKKYLGNSTS